MTDHASHRPRAGRPRRRVHPLALAALILAGATCLQLLLPTASSGRAQPGGSSTRGRELYLQSCATCHGRAGEGTERGPSLIGAGAASTDFYLSTGRMPIAEEADDPKRARPAFSHADIDALVAYVAAFGGPAVPELDLAGADLNRGLRLYQDSCAACHSATGTGGALTSGQVAPGLQQATPVQIAEAVRIGPGAMPVFDPETLDDRELDAVVAYTVRLRQSGNPGGQALGRVGPVPEGLVAWVVGLGLLLIVIRWIGKGAGA